MSGALGRNTLELLLKLDVPARPKKKNSPSIASALYLTASLVQLPAEVVQLPPKQTQRRR